MLEQFCKMSGEPSRSIKCDIMTCDSEMETAHRNYALLHYMKDRRVRVWLRRIVVGVTEEGGGCGFRAWRGVFLIVNNLLYFSSVECLRGWFSRLLNEFITLQVLMPEVGIEDTLKFYTRVREGSRLSYVVANVGVS